MADDPAVGLTIGGLADATGVSVETVRYYQRRGLLDQPARLPGEYRRYGQREVERIEFVRRAKDLGFTLSEIRELLRSTSSGETGEVLRAARTKLEALRRQEAEARRMQDLLTALMAVCEDGEDECLDLRVAPRAGRA